MSTDWNTRGWNRRDLVGCLAGALAACGAPPQAEEPTSGAALPLTDYRPASKLVAARTPVERARFPVIDVHAHVAFSTGLRKATDPDAQPSLPPAARLEEILGWMDDLNLQTLVNLTGGWGEELERIVDYLGDAGEGRFLVCAEPAWTRVSESDYPEWQAAELERARDAGAAGLKVLKTLGLYLREDGKLVAIDDPRFDPMWDAAGRLGMPIFIHTSDPDAFFDPIDPTNERWEELAAHPDWSFHGSDFPAKAELLAARNRVIERHPNTQFVGLHVGNHPEDLGEVAAWLDRYPNFSVEIGARLGELGRQPRASRRFFESYPDRILFGTDAIPLPEGARYPQQTLEPAMFQAYFRFLETQDEYFDYSPAPTPPQGRWKVSGIGLPDDILQKVYHDNAARLFGRKPLG